MTPYRKWGVAWDREPLTHMGDQRWGRILIPCARPGGLVTSLAEVAKRPRHDLPAGTLMCVYRTSNDQWQQGEIVSCGYIIQPLTSAGGKTIRIAVSTVMDDTWIFLDIRGMSSFPSFLSNFLLELKIWVSGWGPSHCWIMLTSGCWLMLMR